VQSKKTIGEYDNDPERKAVNRRNNFGNLIKKSNLYVKTV